ncbi:MAG TPA: DNA-binding response regulator [Bacteroidales bacterium]|nr:MAG: DNA-binding response regulator [Bacteroidetes bacterium GWF2_33_38]OFY92432.1 MAG: DNA-binding response regulator [Bacteroidetes bacterium RIFOXYA2_FULL_33_7]HBF88484.1 DNA-binding response regulator [Bacteroidales bacterium]
MKIIIIEDEKLTSQDLAETLQKVEPNSEIVAVLSSVKEANAFFEKNTLEIDLIFSDIQLGDGLSFEIFNKFNITTPIIFCTAYDEYALNAFKTNGIDYILKPFSQKTIASTISKYKELKANFSKNSVNIDKIFEVFENQKKQTLSSVLVYVKDKILPVNIENIAVFYIENEITRLLTFDQKTYSINKTMEELENSCSLNFYRANRQFLVNRKAVKEASQYFARKLSVTLTIPFKESIVVSKTKVTDFLNWLANN